MLAAARQGHPLAQKEVHRMLRRLNKLRAAYREPEPARCAAGCAALQAAHRAGVAVHYAVNITGHGWRKLLRHPAAWTYRITQIPPVPMVLDFIRAHAGMDEREAYGTLNMGAGFALFVPESDVSALIDAASSVGIAAWRAGQVETGPKQLIIEPLRLNFGAQDLELR
jgi:phosphoribosylformylglycinamidine cyclo-ligase